MLMCNQVNPQNVALSAMQTQDDYACSCGLKPTEIHRNIDAASTWGFQAEQRDLTEPLFCDRYEILQVLGRGGFAVVFLAKDIVSPQKPLCAIKQLSIAASRSDALQRAREYFAQEAKLLQRLGNHPQIPRMLDYFQIDGEFYLVQEYIQGHTLMAEMTYSGLFSEHQVIHFLQKILPVLKYIHSHRIIHRDIKPANIIRRSGDGDFVLIDFGVARERPDRIDETTFFSHLAGTIGYAPPRPFSYTSYGSDIFALGMTCLHLLTGKLPTDLGHDSTGKVNWREILQVSPFLGHVLDQMLTLSLLRCDEAIAQVIQDLVQNG